MSGPLSVHYASVSLRPTVQREYIYLTVVCGNNGLADLIKGKSFGQSIPVGYFDRTIGIIVVIPSVNFNTSNSMREHIGVPCAMQCQSQVQSPPESRL